MYIFITGKLAVSLLEKMILYTDGYRSTVVFTKVMAKVRFVLIKMRCVLGACVN